MKTIIIVNKEGFVIGMAATQEEADTILRRYAEEENR